MAHCRNNKKLWNKNNIISCTVWYFNKLQTSCQNTKKVEQDIKIFVGPAFWRKACIARMIHYWNCILMFQAEIGSLCDYILIKWFKLAKSFPLKFFVQCVIRNTFVIFRIMYSLFTPLPDVLYLYLFCECSFCPSVSCVYHLC